MASVGLETIHKQTFFVNDLTTRSVTLYPTRAAVVRDIENVTIKPGRNEITIFGLTHFADENSIKIEGHGTDALITDMVVDRRRNKSHNDDSDSDPEDSDEESPENPEIEKLKEEIETFQLGIEDALEAVRSASNQLAYLEQHTLSLCVPTREDSPTNTKDMAENLEAYNSYREMIYVRYRDAQVILQKLREAVVEKQNKGLKLERAQRKSQRKAKKLLQEKEEERLEKLEQEIDRPHWVQRIRITIESNSLPKNTPVVPATVSTGKPAEKEDHEPPAKSKGPSLRISYITTGASWTPRYDLRLDTTSGTGVLTYRAQFLNRTGELWRDANITLSTSQTSFGGLEDRVPLMESWRVTLGKQGFGGFGDDDLYSQKEREINGQKKRQKEAARNVYSQAYKPTSKPYNSGFQGFAPIQQNKLPMLPLGFGNKPPFGAPQVAVSGGLFGNAQSQSNTQGGGLFGSNTNALPVGPNGFSTNLTSNPFPQQSQQSQQSGGLFGVAGSSAFGGSAFGSSAFGQTDSGLVGGLEVQGRQILPSEETPDLNPYDPYDSDADSDTATLNPPQMMGLASSTPSSYGLTTTYELSGTRTISSSPLIRRHVIDEYSLPDVEFSHIALPKLRAAAFLKVRIRNPASTPLLRGPVGLTLDGSFLGNGIVPRCAPKDTFELGLGVDEEVLVEYRKPVKKMASQGMLVKEQVATYERGIRVYNARRNPVKLVLFDQVPVSEDERLKIVILKPKGLRNVGDIVKTTVGTGIVAASVKGSSSGGKQSSEIVAELRKGGGIRYEIRLERGGDAVLPLEYEARLPAGEVMVGRL